MNNIDLSPEELTRLKALAQKATPGPWGPSFLAGYIDVSDDDITVAATVEYDEKGQPTPFGTNADNNQLYIAAAHPGVLLAMCEEIERLRESVALLNEEAEWLAEHMPKTSMIDGKAKVRCLRGMKEWREAARKAVEEA